MGLQNSEKLTDYVMALLQTDTTLSELKSLFLLKLNEFLHFNTKPFVQNLFSYIELILSTHEDTHEEEGIPSTVKCKGGYQFIDQIGNSLIRVTGIPLEYCNEEFFWDYFIDYPSLISVNIDITHRYADILFSTFNAYEIAGISSSMRSIGNLQQESRLSWARGIKKITNDYEEASGKVDLRLQSITGSSVRNIQSGPIKNGKKSLSSTGRKYSTDNRCKNIIIRLPHLIDINMLQSLLSKYGTVEHISQLEGPCEGVYSILVCFSERYESERVFCLIYSSR